MAGPPKRQRVAAYAVILRDQHILLSRLARSVTAEELWTLPGGGLDHGEDPRHAVVREVKEETGLDARIGETARVYSAHLPSAWRQGRRVDAHALRIVYDGWVPVDSPEPRVLEVNGSTMEAAWVSVQDVVEGRVPVVPMVVEALADHQPFRRQRVAAYALIRRDGEVLLTRNSARGPQPGDWTLPGGGIDHGEQPRAALAREVSEECGMRATIGELIDVHDVHFEGMSPSGRLENFHGIQLVFAATVAADSEPRVVEEGGTTDAAAWVSVSDIERAALPVRDVVRHALALGHD